MCVCICVCVCIYIYIYIYIYIFLIITNILNEQFEMWVIFPIWFAEICSQVEARNLFLYSDMNPTDFYH